MPSARDKRKRAFVVMFNGIVVSRHDSVDLANDKADKLFEEGWMIQVEVKENKYDAEPFRRRALRRAIRGAERWIAGRAKGKAKGKVK